MQTKHKIGCLVIALSAIFVWVIRGVVSTYHSSVEISSNIALHNYSQFMVRNFPFEILEKLDETLTVSNSTDLLCALEKQELITREFIPFLILRHRILTGEYPSHDLSLSQILSEDNVWALLVRGYDQAPSNMVIAATSNIDLTRDCPIDANNRTIFFKEGTHTNTIPGLRKRGYVILKNGSIVGVDGRMTRVGKYTGEKPETWSKVYWPSGSVYGSDQYTNYVWKYVYP